MTPPRRPAAGYRPLPLPARRSRRPQSLPAGLQGRPSTRIPEDPGNIEPHLRLGLPFSRTAVSDGWFDWLALPELFPVSFPGVQTKRDAFLIDVDLDRLKTRIADYFNAALSNEEIARRYPIAMQHSSGFVVSDARSVREELLKRGGPRESGFIRHAYRPFDNRWLHWETGRGLLGRPVPDYRPHVFEGNMWLSSAQHLRKDATEPQACFTERIASLHLIERTVLMFPARLRDDSIGSDSSDIPRRSNLSSAARRYLQRLGASADGLFHYVLAVLHDPAYRAANAGARVWNGRASRCRAGPTGRPLAPRTLSADLRRAAASWRGCSIPMRPCPALRKGRYARKSPRSPCRPPLTPKSPEGRPGRGCWRRAKPSAGPSSTASRVPDHGPSVRRVPPRDGIPSRGGRRGCPRCGRGGARPPSGRESARRRATARDAFAIPEEGPPPAASSARRATVSAQRRCRAPSGPESP